MLSGNYKRASGFGHGSQGTYLCDCKQDRCLFADNGGSNPESS